MAARKSTDSSGAINLVGQKFGRLTVVERSTRKVKDRNACWVCRCECGKTADIIGRSLRRGVTQSCGCLGRERRMKANTIHGRSKTNMHKSWRAMLARCYNTRETHYADYGGRGIYVCSRWRKSFASFLDDMGERPPGQTVERIDNDGPYDPGNCRWATRAEQSRNTRRNHRITFQGETKLISEWAISLDVHYNTLDWRIRRWGLETALSTHGPRTKATSPLRS